MNEIDMNNNNIMQGLTQNSDLLQMMSGTGVVFNIIALIFFILISWGLYNISKKLGVKYAWLSWIPVLQMYNIIKSAGKSLWWILWIILFGILGVIIGSIIIGLFVGLIMSGILQLGMVAYILIGIIGYIFMYLLISIGYIIVLHGISKRTGRGKWTTLGLIFIPYIMFPVVGYKLKENTEIKKEVKENIEEVKKEEKGEL